ncbi:MATE family efflux transporter [Marispirochaeta sp.]|jgi:putative MATE family efflux protein|uniref:MATE family efflux transporter n=1 Tax=Marispirochaeta sp. TaxID=2038653 RepID=UPI0029C66768|nr:MATE family efflux transporter [Marispirochaeta sp.]
MSKGYANAKIEMMARGDVGRALFTLSAPAVAGMLVMSLYNVVDTLFVSLMNDTAAIAATGIVFPMFQLVGAIGLTFGVGAASVISRRLGEEDHEAAERTGSTALYSALILGILFSLFGLIYMRSILTLFGATESILESAVLYGRIIIGGSVFQVLSMCLNNLLRAEGASLHSSTGQILGAVLNIVLDPIFIFLLDMGLAGAAVATVISQGIGCFYLLSYYLRGNGALHPLSVVHFRPIPAICGPMMALGVPTFVRQVLGSISLSFLNNAAGEYGDAAIAATSIVFRLFMLLLMSLMGVAQGLQPLVGYNFGAGNIPRVRETLRKVLVTTVAFCTVAGVIFYFFAPGIISIFASRNQTVREIGTLALRLTAVVLVPTGLVLMFGGVFQALGDGTSALLLAAGQQGLFLIPLVLILPRIFGVAGVVAAQPAGFLLAFGVGLLLFVRTKRMLSEREEDSGPTER